MNYSIILSTNMPWIVGIIVIVAIFVPAIIKYFIDNKKIQIEGKIIRLVDKEGYELNLPPQSDLAYQNPCLTGYPTHNYKLSIKSNANKMFAVILTRELFLALNEMRKTGVKIIKINCRQIRWTKEIYGEIILT